MGLKEIVGIANRMFVGTVQSVRYGYDDHNDIVTYTTFKVDENIDGTSGRSVTIKQLGGIVNGLDTRLSDIRYFVTGEKVILTLYKESGLQFTCPVGLHQGVWPLSASNRVDNIPSYQLTDAAEVAQKHHIAAAANQQKTVSASRSDFIALLKDLRSSTQKGAVTK